jgi:hypothetical protein
MKILNYIEDILIISGLVVISTATFLLSFIAGLYVSGSFLLGLGIYFIKYPIKKV